MPYNKELPKDCYKVSVDKSLVDAACIPNVENNGFKTVKDAVGGFFAWPKNQVVLDPKATPPSTIQMIGKNKTAPKLQLKKVCTDVEIEKIRNKRDESGVKVMDSIENKPITGDIVELAKMMKEARISRVEARMEKIE
nr:hypothetical protein [Tanacetum cinerariifolium]